MPEHRHLCRLGKVFVRHPVYFLTVCTAGRVSILASVPPAAVLQSEWRAARERHGWQIGRYVIMPDHVHFFAASEPDCVSLERFVGAWKEWTAKHLKRDCLIDVPIWQPRFFDHILRTNESYAEKWEYVRLNPVRAGLVANPGEWPFAGFIDFDSPMLIADPATSPLWPPTGTLPAPALWARASTWPASPRFPDPQTGHVTAVAYNGQIHLAYAVGGGGDPARPAVAHSARL